MTEEEREAEEARAPYEPGRMATQLRLSIDRTTLPIQYQISYEVALALAEAIDARKGSEHAMRDLAPKLNTYLRDLSRDPRMN